MIVFLSILAFIVSSVITTLATGLTLSVLWGWFMVPIFALPALNIPAAIGVSLVSHFATGQYAEYHSEGAELFTKMFIHTITACIVFLTFGWIVHQFV